jgi:cytochrome c553
MRGIAASLSDKDIADLAAYYSTSVAGEPHK